ncbi:unnamed protein product [Boreogadus saida]
MTELNGTESNAFFSNRVVPPKRLAVWLCYEKSPFLLSNIWVHIFVNLTLEKSVPHQPRTSPHVSGQDYSHSASHCTPRAETSKCEYQPPAEQRGERGRDRHRRSPSFSPDRGSYSFAADHQRSDRSHSGHSHLGCVPGRRDKRYSPTPPSSPHRRQDPHTNRSQGYFRHHSPGGRYSSAPSSSPNRRPDPYSTASQERFGHHGPNRRHPPDHLDSRQIHRNDSRQHTSYSSPYGSTAPRYDSHQAYSAREGHPSLRERTHHVSFGQGNDW